MSSFLAEVSDAGKYLVRAINDGGEAESIANFVFLDQTQIESSCQQIDIQKEVSIWLPFHVGCNAVKYDNLTINILFSFKQKPRFI